MKGFLRLWSAFSTLLISVRADTPTTEGLPNCALQCILTLIPNSPCSLDNTTCICADKQLNSNITNCVLGNCSVKEGLTTKNVTDKACNRPPSDNSVYTTAIIGAGGILAAVAMILRVSTRLLGLDGRFQMDDLTALLAVVLAAALTGVTLHSNKWGFGKEGSAIPFENTTILLIHLYFGEKMYIACVWTTKISLLFFYLRLFPNRRITAAVYSAIIFSSFCLISFVVASVFECWPIDFSWRRWDGEQHWGKCTNVNAQGWANAGFNIILDVIIIMLPLPSLAKLNLPRKKKFFVCAMFCVGFLVTVISVIRLRTLVTFGNHLGPSYDYTPLVILSCLEADLGIVCACMPSLLSFFRRMSQFITSAERCSTYSPRNGGMGSNHVRPVSSPSDVVELVELRNEIETNSEDK